MPANIDCGPIRSITVMPGYISMAIVSSPIHARRRRGSCRKAWCGSLPAPSGPASAASAGLRAGGAGQRGEERHQRGGTAIDIGHGRTFQIRALSVTTAERGCVVDQIVETVLTALEQTLPELAADICERGIVMTGGGSLLLGIDTVLSQVTGLPVIIAADALTCVASGAGEALKSWLRSSDEHGVTRWWSDAAH